MSGKPSPIETVLSELKSERKFDENKQPLQMSSEELAKKFNVSIEVADSLLKSHDEFRNPDSSDKISDELLEALLRPSKKQGLLDGIELDPRPLPKIQVKEPPPLFKTEMTMKDMAVNWLVAMGMLLAGLFLLGILAG
jgi:hypothetical protein